MKTETLLSDLTPLIKHIAKGFYGVPFEDLMQAGAVGVQKALLNYQKDGTCKFSTYAYKYIYGEMYELARKDRKIKVSKEILRLAKQIEIARNSLSLKLGKVPTYEEVSEFLEMKLSDVLEAIYLTSTIVSLDCTNEDNKDYYEMIPAQESLPLEDKLTLIDSITELPEPEQSIIKYRYYGDLTQSEIAKLLGLTQVKVSRYESRGLRQLRKYYE
ncbi:TPA: sigma-70 family RNA polymerase sigma factor [Candidatus Ventrenecus avicola]|nr:sigma-70 family RNA polymerase sigma factor [Candidatus Ventrenecus avicola]